MAADAPIAFLAFANATDVHLQLLKSESRTLFEILEPLQAAGRIAIRREESCALDELYGDLVAGGERIVLFHYAGHADGDRLELEGGAGGREGMARLLGRLAGLKLVVLNGCATAGHVHALLDAGVPAVIATAVPVADQRAFEFARALYEALAAGEEVVAAYDAARGFMEARYGTAREGGMGFARGHAPPADDWAGPMPVGPSAAGAEDAAIEWGLYLAAGRGDELEGWRLPDARTAWEVRLEDDDGPLRDLADAPIVLERRERARTLAGVTCRACGIARIEPTDAGVHPDPTVASASRSDRCAVCGSDQLEAGALRELVADAWLPFTIDADEAVDQVRRLAGARTEALQATALHLPFWRFDLFTRTRAQGERGTLGEVAALEPGQSLLAWEPVEEEIDLAYEDLLVPSASLPADLAPAGADWSWALEEAVPAGGDEPQARVVLDRSLPEAFAVALGHLQRELHGRVVAAIGGLDQRAVRTSTRYRRVQADTVLLPHWCVVEHDGDEGRSWLVNGQNGAVRALRGGVARGGPERGEGRAMAIEGRVREADALAPSTSNAVSVFAGAGIGLMVGSMLGLAVPPGDGTSIVAYFVAAVGGALAALLGLNDAHFSTAKGLRIGAFGLAVVLAAPTGIYVRAHGLLGPDLDARRTALEAEGLEPAAAAAIVEAQAAARGPVGLVGEQGFAKRCEDFDPAGFGGEVELVLQAYSLRGAPWADVAETIGAMPAAHRRDALYAAHAAICSLEDELAERSRRDGS